MNISINITENKSAVTAVLVGEIDAYTAPEIKEKLLDKVENKQAIKMTIDLSGVSYMDSTGLGVFVGLFKELKANHGSLSLIGMSNRLKRLFDITGLTDVMGIHSEIEGEI